MKKTLIEPDRVLFFLLFPMSLQWELYGIIYRPFINKDYIILSQFFLVDLLHCFVYCRQQEVGAVVLNRYCDKGHVQ